MREQYWRSLIAWGVRQGLVRFPGYANGFELQLREEFPDGRVLPTPAELREEQTHGLTRGEELQRAMREGTLSR